MKRKELFTDSRGFRVHINATMILTRITNLLEFNNRFFACKNEKKRIQKYMFSAVLLKTFEICRNRDTSLSGFSLIIVHYKLVRLVFHKGPVWGKGDNAISVQCSSN